MFMRTDDPIADAERYYSEKEKEIEELPECSCCGEHITDEYCYEINDELICETCLRDYYRKAVDDVCL